MGEDRGNSPIFSVRITGFSTGIGTGFLPSTNQWCSNCTDFDGCVTMVTVIFYLESEFPTVPTGHLQRNCTTFLIPNVRVSSIKWARTSSTINAVLLTLTSTYSFPKLIIQHDTAAQKHRDLKQLLHMTTYTTESRRNPNSQYN